MELNRRNFLAGSVGAATMLGLAACSSVHSNSADTPSSSSSAPSSPATSAAGGPGASTPAGSVAAGSSVAPSSAASSSAPVKGEISFSFWGGSTGETTGFNYVKQKFEAANPGTTVNLKIVPYDGFFAGIDRGIQAGNAPDVFRVDYTTIGKYSAKGVLLDVTSLLRHRRDRCLPAGACGTRHQVQRRAVRRSAPDGHHLRRLQQGGLRHRGHHLRARPRWPDAWTWDEFGVGRGTKLRVVPAGQEVPVRLRLDAGRRLPLAVLALPGRRHAADPRPEEGRAAVGCRHHRDGLHQELLRQTSGCPDSATHQDQSVYSDNFFLSQIGADDVRRRLPGARAGRFQVRLQGRRLGRYLHAAEQGRSIGPRRQRDRRAQRRSRTPTWRRPSSSSWSART